MNWAGLSPNGTRSYPYWKNPLGYFIYGVTG